MTSQQTNRQQLDSLVEHITKDTIHAVFAVDEARLFRDVDAIEVNTFIRLCQKHNVCIITPQLVYDFQNPYMVRVFRFMCQKAYQVLEDTKRVQER